jgi:DNA polymerase-4
VLAKLGLRSVGDLARAPLPTLERDLGPATAAHLHALSWGRDDRAVSTGIAEKSLGAEETFATDIGDPVVIRRELLRLAGRTARGLRASGQVAKTISVKLRRADFRTFTRSRTLRDPTDVTQQIYTVACELYEASGLADGVQLRLVGVRAAGLLPAAGAGTQLALGERPAAWRQAESAMDQIARRFGTAALRPGTLVEPGSSGERIRE